METTLQITFKDIERSERVEAEIRERVDRIERIYDRITGCQVRVRAPHHRHRKGTQYVVDIDVALPSSTLNVGREPGDNLAHQEILVAVRDAFNAMERKLRKWKDQHKGRPEHLLTPLQGRIDRLNQDKGSGEIATTDGRLIYFHRNCLIDCDFPDLAVGDTVELSVDHKDADEGPHASMVRIISSLRFVDKSRQ